MDIKKIPTKLKLQDKEEIKMLLRRYWVSMIYHLFLGLILFSIPFFFIVPLFQKGGWGILIFSIILLGALFVIFKTIFLRAHTRSHF